MMGDTFEQKKLSVSFTFRIVEAIKRVRVQPMSPKALPWSLSLATGIIISFLTLGQHFNIINPIGMMKGSPLPGMTKVLKVGEIPVDVVNISNAPVISSQRWNGNGLGYELPNLQNALFMSPQAGDTWTKKADMPTARNALSTGVVNGKIYAIGGAKWKVDEGGRWLYFSTVEEYDPVTDTWTKKTDMPTARGWFSASVVGGKIYAIGGDSGSDRSTMEEYDPATDIWTKKTDMPTAREGLSTSVVNGKIYAIGGATTLGVIQTVEEYNPITDKWSKKADMPTARGYLSTSAVNGRIYAIGGWPQNFPTISTVEQYDPATNTWKKKADMPTARGWFSTSVVNGKIYAIGGTPLGTPFSTVEEYDPTTDVWKKKADMPTARFHLSTSAVNGRIYAIGGGQDGIQALSTIEEYDTGFAGESIQPKGKLPTTWGDVKLARNK